MRNAEEILKENLPFGILLKEGVIYAINQAREEAIEECKMIVEKAKLHPVKTRKSIEAKIMALIKDLK